MLPVNSLLPNEIYYFKKPVASCFFFCVPWCCWCTISVHCVVVTRKETKRNTSAGIGTCQWKTNCQYWMQFVLDLHSMLWWVGASVLWILVFILNQPTSWKADMPCGVYCNVGMPYWLVFRRKIFCDAKPKPVSTKFWWNRSSLSQTIKGRGG